MHTTSKYGMLRLVRPASKPPVPDSLSRENDDLLASLDAYYRQVEQHARQIRSSDDVGNIIRILDKVLVETGRLRSNNRLKTEQIQQTEQKIQSLKKDLLALQAAANQAVPDNPVIPLYPAS